MVLNFLQIYDVLSTFSFLFPPLSMLWLESSDVTFDLESVRCSSLSLLSLSPPPLPNLLSMEAAAAEAAEEAYYGKRKKLGASVSFPHKKKVSLFYKRTMLVTGKGRVLGNKKNTIFLVKILNGNNVRYMWAVCVCRLGLGRRNSFNY